MSTSGEAADQVVKIVLDGTDILVRATGDGARDFIRMLLSELRKPQKTKGRASLASMLKQKKPVKVFDVEDKDLKRFCLEAKKYGLLYHVIKDRNKNDGKCEVMVRAEDASKMNRIFAKLKLGESRQTEIKTVVENSLKKGKQPPERTTPQRSPEDRFIEELFKKPQKEKTENDNPSVARTEKSRPSEPTSKTSRDRSRSRDTPEKRPSVRKQLDEYKRQKKEQTKTPTQTKSKSKNISKGSRSNGRT